MLQIRKVSNGFIVYNDHLGGGTHGEHIYKRLEEVFDFCLFEFEGRGRFFGGKKFGKVIILDEPTKDFPEVEPA